MIDKEWLKDKIEIAKKLVEGEEEPIKTAVFQVILAKLIESDHITTGKKADKGSEIYPESPKEIAQNKNGKEELAKNSNLAIQELDDVIYVNGDTIQLLVSLKGQDSEKQLIGSKCILTTSELILGKEWMKSSVLTKLLESSGISVTHLARNLRKHSDVIRIRGAGQGSELEYKITGPGKISTFKTIEKLARGENPSKSESQ